MHAMMFRILLAWTLLAASALAQEPHVKYDATPLWAIEAALADAKTLPPDIASRSRYCWLRSGTPDELATLAFVINSSLGRIPITVMPGASAAAVPFAGGRLVRLDFGLLATDADRFANLAATWERLSDVDRDFGTVLVDDQIVTVPRFKHTDGKFYTRQHRITKTRVNPWPQWAELSAALGGTLVPVIDCRELRETALTTLDGGLYYEFRGITRGTTLKEYLALHGANEEQVAALQSLEKAVVLNSGVTAKERMVSLFRGSGVRASAGGGLVALTFDPFDEDLAASDSAVRNLLNFRGRGSEVILELPNGYHEWTLWDQQGRLVRVVPPFLADDHQVPEPFTNNLQPGLSCLRCHGPDDGWKGFGNDVQVIQRGGTDLFGDLSAADQQQQIVLLASLYSGDWFIPGTGPFAVGRLSYNRACFESTGRGSKEIAALITTLHDGYAYQLLDVWAVARELGIEGLPPSDGNPLTDEDERAACDVLRQFIGAAPVPGGVAREDATIAAVLAGIEITRRFWQTGSSIAYERCYQRGLK
jgi:hypothetical protein